MKEIKMIGIVGALGEEVEQFVEDMQVKKETVFAGMTFYEGILSNKKVVVVKCGIGKVNSAICTQALIDNFDVDILLNAGVAGGLLREINVGDIVISTDAMTHDMDCTKAGNPLGEIPRMDTSSFKADEDIINLLLEVNKEVNPDINAYTGRVLTGDQFICGKEIKDYLIENFDGACAEMEGVALAQAAYLNNIPYCIIRAISDKADGTANIDYMTFKDGAIVHLVKLIEETLKRL